VRRKTPTLIFPAICTCIQRVASTNMANLVPTTALFLLYKFTTGGCFRISYIGRSSALISFLLICTSSPPIYSASIILFGCPSVRPSVRLFIRPSVVRFVNAYFAWRDISTCHFNETCHRSSSHE